MPWKQLAVNPAKYVKDGIPPDGHLQDPSYMHKIDAIALYLYWYKKQENGSRPLTFVGLEAEIGKKQAPVWKEVETSSEGEVYEELEDKDGTSNNEIGLSADQADEADAESPEVSRAEKGKARLVESELVQMPAPGSPATAMNHLTYLKQLTKERDYISALMLLQYAVSHLLFI